jgi:hypothetical protein
MTFTSTRDTASPATRTKDVALRVTLGFQIVLGLLWGISMLFFAPLIVLGDQSGAHIEKIAIEGGAHLALVLGAILVWRSPYTSRDLLVVMVFLNGIWALTDAVYIPAVSLAAIDFQVKLVVNAALCVGLLLSGRRTGVL